MAYNSGNLAPAQNLLGNYTPPGILFPQSTGFKFSDATSGVAPIPISSSSTMNSSTPTGLTALKPTSPQVASQPVSQPPTQTPVSAPISSAPAAGSTANPYTMQNGQWALGGTPAPQPAPSATPTFPGLVGSLVNTSLGNQAIGQNAADIAAKYGQQYADIGRLGAAAQGGTLTTGTTPVAQGNAAVIAQTTAAQQGAVARGEEAALQGTGQQLTAQQQAQQGLGTAIGATQPQLGAFGQGYYNPLNPSAGATGGGAYGNGPAAAANVASVQDQTTQVNTLSAARQSASAIVQNNLNPLLTQYNVNPSDLNAVNRFIQQIAGQTSSPQYQILSNVMNDLASVYAQILTPPGGNPSDYRTQIAQSLLNPSASAQTFSQVIASLDAQAQSKISGIQTNIQNLNTGQNVNPTSLQTQNASTNLFSW